MLLRTCKLKGLKATHINKRLRVAAQKLFKKLPMKSVTVPPTVHLRSHLSCRRDLLSDHTEL